MAENKAQDVEIQADKAGKVTFNNDVIATIAALATVDVPGVAGMSGGFTSGVAELLGRKNLTKGVKVEVGTTECAVDLNLVIRYGAKIHEVCAKIQEEVCNAIETMTGLKAVSYTHLDVYKRQTSIRMALYIISWIWKPMNR